MTQVCGLDHERAFVQRHVLLHPVLTQSAGIRIGLTASASVTTSSSPPALGSREQGERPRHPATYNAYERSQIA